MWLRLRAAKRRVPVRFPNAFGACRFEDPAATGLVRGDGYGHSGEPASSGVEGGSSLMLSGTPAVESGVPTSTISECVKATADG